MAASRFDFSYRENASKLHRKVGDTLRSSPFFSSHLIFQEYPINRIDSSYKGSHFYDWVILDLLIVIECHGEQHYEKINFGGISDDDAHSNFLAQRYRDRKKMDAAIKAGFTFIEVPYWDLKKIDSDYLYNLYEKNKNLSPLPEEVPVETNNWKEKNNQKVKEIRHLNYEKTKRRLKNEVSRSS